MNFVRQRFLSVTGVSILCGIVGGLLVARSIFQVYPVPASNAIAYWVNTVTGPLVAPAQALMRTDTTLVGRVPGSRIDGPALITLGALLLACIIGSGIRGFKMHRPNS